MKNVATKNTQLKWYVSSNVTHDEDTGLFTKRIKAENLRIETDRTIAHIDGITEKEAEANAKLMAAALEMAQVLGWINLKYGDIEGERELTPVEIHMVERVREVLTLIKTTHENKRLPTHHRGPAADCWRDFL